jgi:hypothetical protein
VRRARGAIGEADGSHAGSRLDVGDLGGCDQPQARQFGGAGEQGLAQEAVLDDMAEHLAAGLAWS